MVILCQGTYEEAKEELIEMAAFIGVQLVRFMGGEWYQYINKDYENCAVHKIKSTTTTSLNCLGVIVGGYEEGIMNWPRGILLKAYDTRTI